MMNKKIRNLAKELCELNKATKEKIAFKFLELWKLLRKDLKREPQMKEIHNLVKDEFNYAQVKYYMAIRHWNKKHIKSIGVFLNLCYANSKLYDTKNQKAIGKDIKAKKFNYNKYSSNPSVYLKKHYPYLRSKFDKVLIFFDTIYTLRQLVKSTNKFYDKLDDIHKLKYWHEWSYLKKELDDKIKKPSHKGLWTITLNSKSGYKRFKNRFREDIMNDNLEAQYNSLSFKVKEEWLIDNLEQMKKFHLKIT